VNHAIHPEADAEFAETVRYYAAIDPQLGARFYLEMQRLIRVVCDQPDRFNHFSLPARRALAMGFPYSVVYLQEADRIWIVAVMHAKRRPGYWRQRLA